MPITILVDGVEVGQRQIDMLVDEGIIVEIKSTEILPLTSKRQLRGYLAATGLRLGILLHFGPKACYYRVIGPAEREQLKPVSS